MASVEAEVRTALKDDTKSEWSETAQRLGVPDWGLAVMEKVATQSALLVRLAQEIDKLQGSETST
jgi:hypothetical protein